MSKRDNKAVVEHIEQEASRTHNGNQEQIATELYRASVQARQRGEDQLSGALLGRALVLALPFILQGDNQPTFAEEN